MVTQRRTTHRHLSGDPLLQRRNVQEAPAGGVAKGAFSESDAEAKFNKWLSEKQTKIENKTNKLASDAKSAEKSRLAAETKIKEERAAALAEKKAAAEAAAREAAEAAAAESAEAAAPAEGEAPAEA